MSLVTETDGGAQVTAQARSRHRYQRYERQTSAGGVVYRIRDGQMEVLLCGRKEPLLWCLPKGTPDPGEGIRATAVREVQEETGVSVIIQGKLGSVHYFFMRVQYSTRCDKTVHYYLMKPIDGDPARHDHEFDEVRWFTVRDALATMTYPNDIRIMQKAVDVVSGKVRLRSLGQGQSAANDGRPGEGAHG